MTIGEILAASVPYLEKRGIPDARLASEHLASRLLRCKRLDLPLRASEPLDEKRIDAMRRGVSRLAAGEPLQYVLGRWDFRRISLKTDRRALIPRPETEQLVQLLLDSDALCLHPSPRVLDYGTGSGCIALSIADEAPTARVAATDISPDALALARENADALALSDRVRFIDTSELELADIFDAQSFEAIISNPPYISTAACANLLPSVRDYEPRTALDGGPDGLDLLRAVIEDALMLLVSGGMIFLEFASEERQALPLVRFLEEAGFEEIRLHKDLRGAERLLSAKLAAGV
ncbi:MAG: peptide chain release factor N(5)-glutamine methyltransferase [Kiritimatiellaeota bacterium]|nr:peptide chain release factor N(5)-glutamine methyltransferase [Kiritimatiellota bacterium]